MRMPGLRLPSSAHTRNRQGSARNDYPEAQLAGLHYTVAARRRHHFGVRSEKLDDEQLVGFENSEAASAAVAVSLDVVALIPARATLAQNHSRWLPTSLRRVAHVADIKNMVCG
jgi:hypothetical protein